MNRTWEIMLVRHPQTTANVDGRYVGRGDTELTDEGRAQARRLASHISAWEPDAVFSSPLGRALDVARSAARELSLEVAVDDRFTELDFGVAEGLTFEETRARGIRFDFKNVAAPVAPHGESRQDIFDRTLSALEDVRRNSHRAVVVTHGGVFRSAIVALLGLPIDYIWTFHIRNAQVAEIRIVEDHPTLERFFQV